LDFKDVVATAKPAVVAIGIRPAGDDAPVHLYVGERNASKLPKLLGTGFCVHRNGMVVTCQHVIDGLYTVMKENGIPVASGIAIFTTYDEDGMGYLEGIPFKRILTPGADIGLIELEPCTSPLPTISVSKELDVAVGEEIAICGYPLGTDIFFYDKRFAGATSLIQKGIISAILPSEFGKIRNELVLGVPAFNGYSGSPVFKTNSPEVVGIVKAISTVNLNVHDEVIKIPLPNTSYAIPGRLMADAIDIGLKDFGK